MPFPHCKGVNVFGKRAEKDLQQKLSPATLTGGVRPMSAELQATTPYPLIPLEQLLIERIRRAPSNRRSCRRWRHGFWRWSTIPMPRRPSSPSWIHQDQALAAHVIRIANSPAYMTRNPVVSLQHAVSMLGMNLMSELAFSASIKGSAFKVPGWDDEVKSLWHYSLASGAYAKRNCTHAAVQCRKRLLVWPVAWDRSSRGLTDPGGLVRGTGQSFSKELVHQLLDGYYIQVGLLVADDWGCRRRSWSLSGFMWTTNMPKPPSRNV